MSGQDPGERVVFVTVGSTNFDALVEAVCRPATLELLGLKGFTKVCIQLGTGQFPAGLLEFVPSDLSSCISPQLKNQSSLDLLAENQTLNTWWKKGKHCMKLEVFRLRPSISACLQEADLVISHAGAGTALEALSFNKRLVVVVNDALMNQHQTELAEGLSQMRCCVACEPQGLHALLQQDFNQKLLPYVPGDPAKFVEYLNNAFVFL